MFQSGLSALHEAVKLKNMSSVNWLFSICREIPLNVQAVDNVCLFVPKITQFVFDLQLLSRAICHVPSASDLPVLRMDVGWLINEIYLFPLVATTTVTLPVITITTSTAVTTITLVTTVSTSHHSHHRRHMYSRSNHHNHHSGVIVRQTALRKMSQQ